MKHLLLDGETSEQLFFRKLEPSDFDTRLPFHQDKQTPEFQEGPSPKNPESAYQEWLDNTFHRYNGHLGGLNALAYKRSDTLQEIELGYSILPSYWKQGYASEVAKKCKTFAFENKLAKSLISIIHIKTITSQKIASNNGMQWNKTSTFLNNTVHIYSIGL